LIPQFEEYLKGAENKQFVKAFGYNLLKGKFVFDKYIIKREFTKGTDRWSLKTIKTYENDKVSYVNTFGAEESNDDINREILMILSMFHVSTPTLVYKHWLNAALKFVFKNTVTSEQYRCYLENLAKSFLYRRYLAINQEDFYTIIYGETAVNTNTPFINIPESEINITKLDCGTAVENFVFNYLDYLLWKDYRKDKQYYRIEQNDPIKDDRIRDFEYTFRSSVEHYYPQNPIDPNMQLKDKDSQWLDNFGNLCLISSSKNSRLSNHTPIAKKDFYSKSTTIDSIKQRIMMAYENWDVNGANNHNVIEEHGKKMKELLLN